jgi:hypothetical protein
MMPRIVIPGEIGYEGGKYHEALDLEHKIGYEGGKYHEALDLEHKIGYEGGEYHEALDLEHKIGYEGGKYVYEPHEAVDLEHSVSRRGRHASHDLCLFAGPAFTMSFKKIVLKSTTMMSLNER